MSRCFRTLSGSVTGRTLPHCYVEIRSIQVANDILNAMDRKQLGDRTVRVRWERRGELLRDVSVRDSKEQDAK